jgi:hypothetical protein
VEYSSHYNDEERRKLAERNRDEFIILEGNEMMVSSLLYVCP